MVTSIWRRECHSRLFQLEYNKPEEFVRCEWQNRLSVHPVYLTYRWFLAILFLATMIFSICDPGRSNKNSGSWYISRWPIYLTHWGYTVCTTQAVLGAWLLTCKLVAERKADLRTNDSEMSFSYKVYWALNTTGIVMALGITVGYWFTVYDPAIHRLDILNLMIHAFNSILMVTDIFLVAHPFRLLHCYWPLLATVCYIVFSYIYYEFGGTDRQDRPVVYSLLDWRLPIRAVISSVFGLLVSLSIHCIAWFLFLIRKWIALSIKKTIALPMHEEKNHTPSEMQPALQMNDIIC